jgi:integrase/recombinase XerD
VEDYRVTLERVQSFLHYLKEESHSDGTVEKYRRDIQGFREWLGERPASREAAAAWRRQLTAQGYAPATVNSMLGAVNALFRYLGWDEFHAKALRVQRQIFRSEDRELSREEYHRLVAAARAKKRWRLELLLETICATGIRVSEVKYITVEAARQGKAEISLKGKIRTILIPGKLARKLLKYCKKQKNASGEIFLTRSGKSMDRRQIWSEMKSLCAMAKVAASKVFPHNLRHLFARVFYKATQDVVKLADVLGHSSLETTRIYLIATGAEHAKALETLGLLI